MHVGPQNKCIQSSTSPEEGIRSSKAEVTGSGGLPGVGAGKGTQVLWRVVVFLAAVHLSSDPESYLVFLNLSRV